MVSRHLSPCTAALRVFSDTRHRSLGKRRHDGARAKGKPLSHPPKGADIDDLQSSLDPV